MQSQRVRRSVQYMSGTPLSPKMWAGNRLYRKRLYRIVLYVWAVAFAIVGSAIAAEPVRILFIGNSFTYGSGTDVKTYRPETVTDLNNGKVGEFQHCSRPSLLRPTSTTT
jgi:hypothetical protein